MSDIKESGFKVSSSAWFGKARESTADMVQSSEILAVRQVMVLCLDSLDEELESSLY